MYTDCSPTTANDTPRSIQWSEKTMGPTLTSPNETPRVSTRPRTSKSSPGL